MKLRCRQLYTALQLRGRWTDVWISTTWQRLQIRLRYGNIGEHADMQLGYF